jgi:hypothetical protein
MKVQFPVRWTDRKLPLDSSDAYIKRVIDGEEVPSAEPSYTYGTVVLETKDVRCYNDMDANHSILRTYFNDSYCIAIGFEDLKRLMVEITGENITIISKAEDKPKRPKRKNDNINPDDDLLI